MAMSSMPESWIEALRPADLESARKLLIEWERFARTLDEAGLIALPERLVNRTVALLDETAL